MQFFEGDLPFVVALFTVERDHGVKCPSDPQLRCIFPRFFQCVVAEHQKTAGHFGAGHRKIQREAIAFRVVIGRTAIFFAGEALGADIQACIASIVGAQQLEQIEADALLRCVVPLDGHVAHLPAGGPHTALLFLQRLHASLYRLAQ